MGSKKNRQVSPDKGTNPAPHSDSNSADASAPINNRPSSIVPWGGTSTHITMTPSGAPRSALETLAALLVMQEVKGRRSPPSTAAVTPEAHDVATNGKTSAIKREDNACPANNRARKRSTGMLLPYQMN
jgi:hypothetical protein